MASTTRRDYYEVLGVPRNAPLDEIKRAYRRLAMAYHPDRNPAPEATEKFKELSEAFEVLADAQKRRVYDTYGHEGLRGQGYGGIVDVDDVFEHFFSAGGVFGDLLSELFGGRRRPRRRRAARGADLLTRVTVSFEEMACGVEREVDVERLRTCKDCGGAGGAAGAPPEVCSVCRGSGEVIQRHGFFSVGTPCPRCQGQGEVFAERCERCGGRGLRLERCSVRVDIPAGVADGARVRLAGEGESGRYGGSPGDLYVAVRVAPHEHFGRDGRDTLAEVEVSPARAALGGDVAVPTLWGEERIKIPAGSQNGDVIVVKRAGLPVTGSSRRGDHRVTVRVIVPRKLKRRAKDLYRELLTLEGEEK